MKLEPMTEEEIRDALKNHEPLDPSPDPQCSFCRLILAWIITRASFEYSEQDPSLSWRLRESLEDHIAAVKARVGWKKDKNDDD